MEGATATHAELTTLAGPGHSVHVDVCLLQTSSNAFRKRRHRASSASSRSGATSPRFRKAHIRDDTLIAEKPRRSVQNHHIDRNPPRPLCACKTTLNSLPALRVWLRDAPLHTHSSGSSDVTRRRSEIWPRNHLHKQPQICCCLAL